MPHIAKGNGVFVVTINVKIKPTTNSKRAQACVCAAWRFELALTRRTPSCCIAMSANTSLYQTIVPILKRHLAGGHCRDLLLKRSARKAKGRKLRQIPFRAFPHNSIQNIALCNPAGLVTPHWSLGHGWPRACEAAIAYETSREP